MYLNDYGRFPFLDNRSNTPATSWQAALEPYYSVKWTQRGYHCPEYKGTLDDALPAGSYGYNGRGTDITHMLIVEGIDLGLSPIRYEGNLGVTESQVRVPSEMIEIGDTQIIGTGDPRKPSSLIYSGEHLLVPRTVLRPEYQIPRHPGGMNLVFCDGHVALMKWRDFTNNAASAALWNNDHEPHPETW